MDPPLPLEPPTYLDLLPVELRRKMLSPLYLHANAAKKMADLKKIIAEDLRLYSLRDDDDAAKKVSAATREKRKARSFKKVEDAAWASSKAGMAARVYNDNGGGDHDDDVPLDVYRQHKFIRKESRH